MPKYTGQIFSRKRRTSQSDGTLKTHKMDPSLSPMLGQGGTIVLHGLVYALDADARLVVRVTHGCLGDSLPSEEGFVVSLTGDSNTRTAPGGFRIETTSTLLADVEVEADVDRTQSTGEVGVEFELWATVIP